MVTRGVLGFYAYAPLVTLSTARLTRRKRASMSNTNDSFRCADLSLLLFDLKGWRRLEFHIQRRKVNS